MGTSMMKNGAMKTSQVAMNRPISKSNYLQPNMMSGMGTSSKMPGMNTYQTMSGMNKYQTMPGMNTYQTMSGMNNYQTMPAINKYQTMPGMNTYQTMPNTGSNTATTQMIRKMNLMSNQNYLTNNLGTSYSSNSNGGMGGLSGLSTGRKTAMDMSIESDNENSGSYDRSKYLTDSRQSSSTKKIKIRQNDSTLIRSSNLKKGVKYETQEKVTYQVMGYKEYRFYSQIVSQQVRSRYTDVVSSAMFRTVSKSSKKMTLYEEWLHFRLQQTSIAHTTQTLKITGSSSFGFIDRVLTNKQGQTKKVSDLVGDRLKECQLDTIFKMNNAKFQFVKNDQADQNSLDEQMVLVTIEPSENNSECLKLFQKYQAIVLAGDSYALLNPHASQDYYNDYLYRQFETGFQSLLILSCDSTMCTFKLPMQFHSIFHLAQTPELVISGEHKELQRLVSELFVSKGKSPSSLFEFYSEQYAKLNDKEKEYWSKEILQMNQHVRLVQFPIGQKEQFFNGGKVSSVQVVSFSNENVHLTSLESIMLGMAMGMQNVKVYSMTRRIFGLFATYMGYYDSDDLNLENEYIGESVEEQRKISNGIRYGHRRNYLFKSVYGKQNYWCFTYQWIIKIRIRIPPPIYIPPPSIYCDDLDYEFRMLFCEIDCNDILFYYRMKGFRHLYKRELRKCCEEGQLTEIRQHFDCCTLDDSYENCSCPDIINDIMSQPESQDSLLTAIHQKAISKNGNQQYTLVDHCCEEIGNSISNNQIAQMKPEVDGEIINSYLKNHCKLDCYDDNYFKYRSKECCDKEVFSQIAITGQISQKLYDKCCEQITGQPICSCEEVIRSKDFPLKEKVDLCCDDLKVKILDEISRKAQGQTKFTYINDDELMGMYFKKCDPTDICKEDQYKYSWHCCVQRMAYYKQNDNEMFEQTVFQCCNLFEYKFDECKSRDCLTSYSIDPNCCNDYIRMRDYLLNEQTTTKENLKVYYDVVVANHCCKEDSSVNGVCNCDEMMQKYEVVGSNGQDGYEQAIKQITQSLNYVNGQIEQQNLISNSKGLVITESQKRLIQSYTDCYCGNPKYYNLLSPDQYYRYCCFDETHKFYINRPKCCDMKLEMANSAKEYLQTYEQCCKDTEESTHCGCKYQILTGRKSPELIEHCCKQLRLQDVLSWDNPELSKRMYIEKCCDNPDVNLNEKCCELRKDEPIWLDKCCGKPGFLPPALCKSCILQTDIRRNPEHCCDQFYNIFSGNPGKFDTQETTEFMRQFCCYKSKFSQKYPNMCSLTCDYVVENFYDFVYNNLGEAVKAKNKRLADLIKQYGKAINKNMFRFRSQDQPKKKHEQQSKRKKVIVKGEKTQKNNKDHKRRLRKQTMIVESKNQIVQQWFKQDSSNIMKVVDQCCDDFLTKGYTENKQLDRFINICGYNCFEKEILKGTIHHKACCIDLLKMFKDKSREAFYYEQYHNLYKQCCNYGVVFYKDNPDLFKQVCQEDSCVYFNDEKYFDEKCCDQYLENGYISQSEYILKCSDMKLDCTRLIKLYKKGGDNMKNLLKERIKNECCHKDRDIERELCDDICDPKTQKCYGCEKFVEILNQQFQQICDVDDQIDKQNHNCVVDSLAAIYSEANSLATDKTIELAKQTTDKNNRKYSGSRTYIDLQETYFNSLGQAISHQSPQQRTHIQLNDFDSLMSLKMQPLDLWKLCCQFETIPSAFKSYCSCDYILNSPKKFPKEIVQYCCSTDDDLYIKYYLKIRDICVKDCSKYPLHPECCQETFEKYQLQRLAMEQQLIALGRVEQKSVDSYIEMNQDIKSVLTQSVITYHETLYQQQKSSALGYLLYFIDSCCEQTNLYDLYCKERGCKIEKRIDFECCSDYINAGLTEFYFFRQKSWVEIKQDDLITECCNELILGFEKLTRDMKIKVIQKCPFEKRYCEISEYFEVNMNKCCEEYRIEFMKQPDYYKSSVIGSLTEQLFMEKCCSLYMNDGKIPGLESKEVVIKTEDYGFEKQLSLYQGAQVFYQVETYYIQDMCCQFGYDLYKGQCQGRFGWLIEIPKIRQDCGLIMGDIRYQYSPIYILCCIQMYGYRYCVEKYHPPPPPIDPPSFNCIDLCYLSAYPHFLCVEMGCYVQVEFNSNCHTFLGKLYEWNQYANIDLYHYIRRQELVCCMDMFYSGAANIEDSITNGCCEYMKDSYKELYNLYCQNECDISNIKTYKQLAACCNKPGLSPELQSMCNCRLDFYEVMIRGSYPEQKSFFMDYFTQNCCAHIDMFLTVEEGKQYYIEAKAQCDCNQLFDQLKSGSTEFTKEQITQCCDHNEIPQIVHQKYCKNTCIDDFPRLPPIEQQICCITHKELGKAPCDCNVLLKISEQFFKDYCCIVEKKDIELCRDTTPDPCNMDEIEELLQKNNYFQDADLRRMKKHKEGKCKRLKKRSHHRTSVPSFLRIKN